MATETSAMDRIASVLERLAEERGSNAALVEALKEIQPKEEIGYGHPEFQARLRAEGFMDEWAVPVFQNGRAANPRNIPEHLRLNVALIPAGKYVGGTVEVTRGGKDEVYLHYKSQTIEDRMTFSTKFPTFERLLETLLAEVSAKG